MSADDLALVALVPAVLGLALLGWRVLRPTAGAIDWRAAGAVSRATVPGAAADERLWTLDRIVVGHLEARQPTGMLAQHLRGLADRRLGLRHDARFDSDRAVALLGTETMAVLTAQPPRRLTLREIDEIVRRIEEL